MFFRLAVVWADYQVRSDLAVRRHWTLVFLGFSFCWWALSLTEKPLLDLDPHEQPETPPAAAGASVVGAVRVAVTLLAGMVGGSPAGAAASAAGLALEREADLPLLPATTNYC